MSVETMQKNIARLMVRRHLRSWLGSDVISESLLVAIFIRTMQAHPDLPMRDIVPLVDHEVHQLMSIVLGGDPQEPLGLDP